MTSSALIARRQAAVARGVAFSLPIVIREARGAVVYDVEGRRFIDFAGGIGVLNVGHTHPKVVAAIKAQAERLTHACFMVATYESYVELAERLNQLVPGAWPKKTVLFNSGAEAVENAVKIARAATGRPAVLVFEHAFHGRTIFGLTLTGKVNPYKVGFGPFASEVYRLPYPYCFRCPRHTGEGKCCQAEASNFLSQLATLVDPTALAAVVIEPVLGEGGFIPAPPEFLRMLVDWCREHGVIFIADEVQTGFGRTGTMFAMEHAGVAADLTVLAKSLGGGLPISAVTGRQEIMDAPAPGGLGGTFAGNPVACAAALAALDVFEEERLVERARMIGATVREHFLSWKATYPWIGDVRGVGAMQALEIVIPNQSKAPDQKRTSLVQKLALERGLLTLTAGTWGNVIRTLMPLTISDSELAEGLEILGSALKSASAL